MTRQLHESAEQAPGPTSPSRDEAHTPGPWRLRMHPADPRIERPEYPDSVVDANGKSVVFACVTMTTSREGEWLANARLIAAAPELYAAIRNSDDAHWTTAMRAAMAKVEGR